MTKKQRQAKKQVFYQIIRSTITGSQGWPVDAPFNTLKEARDALKKLRDNLKKVKTLTPGMSVLSPADLRIRKVTYQIVR